MKRRISFLLAVLMVLSMLPMAVAAQEGEVLFSGTNVTASPNAPVVHTWTAESNGTLTVAMSGTPGWKFTIFDAAGNTVGLPKSSSLAKTNTFDLVAGTTYTFTATGFNASTWDEVEGKITYTVSFLSNDPVAPTQKVDYEISNTTLVLGNNNVSMLETAVATIFEFEPSEMGVYTFTAPAGAKVGYWGAGSWFLMDPKSETNTCEWTCTGVGQSAFIGVAGVEGNIAMNIAKTGEYNPVQIIELKYENKATLAPFALPEGAKLGSYVDVMGDASHTAVLGADGYYHLDSADGDILLVDFNYAEIILSAALQSDRPVMNAYVTDENGDTVKYDIGDAVLAYEEVMDANGYYPVTEDIILFYKDYAVGSGTYTYHLTGMDYNEECVWMYCMRTVDKLDATEPEEPEQTEPSEPETEPSEPEPSVPETTEPEVTEPETEPSEPEVTEPVSGTLVLNAYATAESGSKYTYKFAPETDGTLIITVGDGSTQWVSDLYSFKTWSAIASASGTNEGSYSVEVTAGVNYYIRVYASSGALAETPVKAVFMPEGATEPEVPETTEPEVTEPEVTEPEVTEPEVTEPEVTEPEVTEPSVPETTEPAPSEPALPDIPVIDDADVPAGTYYAIVADGKTTYYTSSAAGTMNAALKKITGDGYLKFYQNMSLGSSYTIDVYNGNIIVDLNGCMITSAFNGAGALYVDGGAATLVDTSAEGKGTIENISKSGYGIEIYHGSVTMLSGNVIGTSMGVKVWPQTSFTMNGGYVEAPTAGIRVETGNFVMNGGHVVAGSYGANILTNSTVTINGGTLENTKTSFAYPLYAATNATVSVSGGNFKGSAISGNGLVGAISGGYFSTGFSENYLATDCTMESNMDPDYLWVVVDPNAVTPEEPELTPVAMIGDRTYTSLADAIANCAAGEYIVLIDNVTEDVTVTGDLYLDLNGKTLTGNVVGNGTLYAMDSATNDYNDDDMGGIVGTIMCNVPAVIETEITGEPMKYLAISGRNGMTFHRFYVGITYVSLNPAATGFGYKAEFYGDAAVQGMIDHIGYDLWITETRVITRTADFQNVLTLRLNNFLVEDYGDTAVNARVFITLTGDVKIESEIQSYSMRQMVETINATYTQFTAAQLKAAAEMILANPVMLDWEVENILANRVPAATVETFQVKNETINICEGYKNPKPVGTATMTFDAYTFTPQDTLEEAQNGAYSNWIADYYVSMDQEVQEGLYLVGNYGDYGWIAFEAPAGQTYTNVGLMTTFGRNWTYEQIVEAVDQFKCGVVDLKGNHAGATFTVQLRLVNPADANDYIVVTEISTVISEGIPQAEVQTQAVQNETITIYKDYVNPKPVGSATMTFESYSFVPQQTLEEAQASQYSNWIADYYVSMDREVQEGLYLVGNYGDYGWIAFEAPAGQTYTNVGLMTTFGRNWTYEQVVEAVDQFQCGVMDLNSNNTGATFTVQLRLVNPADANDYIVVNEISTVIG